MAYEPDSDEEDEEAYKVPVHTGKYVVKMRIDRPILQILPIEGQRIRIYYKGESNATTALRWVTGRGIARRDENIGQSM
jgi:hypothetical protein